jgi:hypothetical protein
LSDIREEKIKKRKAVWSVGGHITF